MKVADEVWLATALLHYENRSRESFTPQEISRRAERLHPEEPCRPGVQYHVYLHCVANKAPNPAAYRMLFRLPDGTLRLYRPGDECHPGRTGKIHPEPAGLPDEYRPMLDWYDSCYRVQAAETSAGDGSQPDFFDRLTGLGKDTWRQLGGGDAVIRWLRSDAPDAKPPWEGQKFEPVGEPGGTFWDEVRRLREGGYIPRQWRAADLAPFLKDRYKPSTIGVMPANFSISKDGDIVGDLVRKGQTPQAYRIGRGLYELIDDPGAAA